MSGLSINGIQKIGPSKIGYVKACPLRYVISKNISNVTVDFNPPAFFGTFLHEVLSSFIKNKWRIEEFEHNWEEVLLRQCLYYQVDREGIEYHLPYYAIKRTKLKSFLNRLDFLNGAEVFSELDVSGSVITGSIDIIEVIDGTIRISDFKTGPIFEFIDFKISVPRSSYVEQLIAYGVAILEDDEYDVRVDQIQLRLYGLNEDEVFDLNLTETLVNNLKRDMNQLVHAINQAIEVNELDSLAIPGEDSCRYCTYKTECKPLQKYLSVNLSGFNSMMMIKTIGASFDDQNKTINISCNQGLISIHRIPTMEFDSVQDAVAQGNSVFIYNLYTIGGGNVKRWSKRTSFKII